ncbi:MAG: hypothetical protein J6A58_11965 [Oscillospiraceae bacterium]|nr:hypothetical protein [Oscillospiraceae bacterium]
MMTQEMLVKFFEENEKDIRDMVLQAAVYVYNPDRETCATLEKGLRALGEQGNKSAIALYCAVAVCNNNCGTFSEKIAMEMIFESKAIKEYHDLIRDEFQEDADPESYDYYWAAPTLWLSKMLSGERSEIIEQTG